MVLVVFVVDVVVGVTFAAVARAAAAVVDVVLVTRVVGVELDAALMPKRFAGAPEVTVTI